MSFWLEPTVCKVLILIEVCYRNMQNCSIKSSQYPRGQYHYGIMSLNIPPPNGCNSKRFLLFYSVHIIKKRLTSYKGNKIYNSIYKSRTNVTPREIDYPHVFFISKNYLYFSYRGWHLTCTVPIGLTSRSLCSNFAHICQ